MWQDILAKENKKKKLNSNLLQEKEKKRKGPFYFVDKENLMVQSVSGNWKGVCMLIVVFEMRYSF